MGIPTELLFLLMSLQLLLPVLTILLPREFMVEFTLLLDQLPMLLAMLLMLALLLIPTELLSLLMSQLLLLLVLTTLPPTDTKPTKEPTSLLNRSRVIYWNVCEFCSKLEIKVIYC